MQSLLAVPNSIPAKYIKVHTTFLDFKYIVKYQCLFQPIGLVNISCMYSICHVDLLQRCTLTTFLQEHKIRTIITMLLIGQYICTFLINMFITESKTIIMFLMDNTSVLSHQEHNNYVNNRLFSIKNMIILASCVPIDASLLIL